MTPVTQTIPANQVRVGRLGFRDGAPGRPLQLVHESHRPTLCNQFTQSFPVSLIRNENEIGETPAFPTSGTTFVCFLKGQSF
jgi:hypothetical protein